MIEFKEKIRKLIFIFLMIPLSVFSQSTGNIKITWDKNTETDLAGYKVYLCEKSVANGDTSAYAVVVDKKNTVASFEWRNLQLGKMYYMAVTAYDNSGNESGFSNEVSQFLKEVEPPKDTTPPDAPGNVRVIEVSITIKVEN